MQARFLHKNPNTETRFVLIRMKCDSAAAMVVILNFLYRYSAKGAIRGMSPEKEYLKWRQSPRVGCLFARKIAIKPSQYSQRIFHISTAEAPDRVANKIAGAVNTAIADGGASAVLLLFPALTSLEETARIMLALGSEPEWTVTPRAIPAPPPGYRALNIVRAINFGTGSCPSEALVLGSFPDFPPTRRAPITALELFIGEPRPMGPLDDEATTKANLAHMPMHLPSHDMFMAMWHGSHDGRSRELGGADNRAKAKVSMALPLTMANRLGCGA